MRLQVVRYADFLFRLTKIWKGRGARLVQAEMTLYRMLAAEDRPEIIPAPVYPGYRRARTSRRCRSSIFSRLAARLRALFARVLHAPRVVSRSGWADDTYADVSRLAPVTRDALRKRWQREGLRRHAAIILLSMLAIDLLVLGAPASLVERCHCAAIDAARDARSAFGLASKFGGTELAPTLPRLPSRAAPTYERVARDAAQALIAHLVAANVARVEAASESDRAIRDVHVALARSETAAAGLAARVVRFCAGEGGPDARHAATETLLETAKARKITLREDVVLRAMELMAG
jgi:hypothetical protein